MVVSGRVLVDVDFPALTARVLAITGLTAEMGIKIRYDQKKRPFWDT